MFKRKLYVLAAVAGIIIGALGINVLGVPGDNGPFRFKDVNDNDWYYSYVKYLSDNNIVNGISENEFSPDGTFTIAESAAVITRYLGIENEAQDRQKAMQLLGIEGSDKWYAGYVQLMHEAGIIDVTKYGCSINGKSVSINDFKKLEMPVKRYEFAAFVIRSFELDGTTVKCAVGDGSGNVFIYGGFYNESELEKYIPFIKDYKNIPENYGYYVLKAYYNGIFNGDNLGNFNPSNNLTRAEMAKIISVILDKSQRIRIDVSLDEEPDTKDEILPPEPVKADFVKKLLLDSVSSVALYTDKDKMYYLYQKSTELPKGYILEIRQYRKKNNGFDSVINSSTNNFLNCSFEKGDKLVFIIKNSFNNKTEGAYITILNGLDNVAHNDLTYAR